MADWFETRFREPVDAGRPSPAFAARVRALVVEEWQADVGSTPSDHTDVDDHEEDLIMLETQDDPKSGTEPASPRHRSPGLWLLAAATVAALALAGALLVAVAGDDDENDVDTVTSVPTTVAGPRNIREESLESHVEPGTYFIDPDGDPSTPLTVTFQVAAAGWSGWIGAVKFADDGGHAAVSIATVTNLVKDGCTNHAPADPPVGPTVDDLATALTQLSPFEVTSAPRDVTMFGYRGKHVALMVPDLPVSGSGDNRRYTGCTGGEIHSWIAPLNGSYYGYNAEAFHTEEFWILDVEGTRLVIETNQSPGRLPQDLAELQAILDSIRIQP